MASSYTHPNPTTAKKPAISKGACNEEVTTAQNLRLLNAILDIVGKPEAPKTQARRPRAPSKTKTNNASQSSSNIDGARQVQSCEETAAVRAPRSPLEQKKLATATFNSSLKVLSALAKQQQLNRVKNEPIESEQPRASKLSPSKTTSPNKKTIPAHDAVADSEKKDLKLHAECASVALDVLRQLDENTEDESIARKREQGAILLLEKFITLEMQDLSHVQASKIHEQYWKRRKGSSSTLNNKRKDRGDIHAMLLNNPQAMNTADFSSICSFQSQILRLALLEGPLSITSDLVKAVALENPGSPASVILWGLEEGLISPEKTERQLHTLSQALSRLASTGMKMQQSAISVESFILLVKAQLIKIKACESLSHNADLSVELWSAVHRAIHHLVGKEKTLDQFAYPKIIEAVKDLQQALEKSTCSSQVPLNVQHLLVQLAEANHDTDNAIQILNEMCSSTNNHERLFCLCKLATLHLDRAPSAEVTVSCVRTVLSALSDCPSASLILTPERLVVLARLRKLCLSRIVSANSGTNEIAEFALEPVLLRVVLRMLDFNASQLVRVFKANEKQFQPLQLATLKNIEAVSDVEKYVMSNPEDHLEAYLGSIDQCFDLLKRLVDIQRQSSDYQDFSVINALKLRLSNVYWRAHLCSTVQLSELYSPVELASRSINALDGVSLKQLNQAALGPRLEKLANMQSAAGLSEDALASLERAVHHYIASEALTDAVEAALSRRSCEVWTDSTSICFQLARVLRARYAAITDYSPDRSFASHILIKDDIPDLHLAVLLEYQALHIIKKESQSLVTKDFVQLARRVLELVPAHQYRVWRLRFLSQFLLRLMRGKILEAQQKVDLNALIEGTMPETAHVDPVFLQEFNTASTTLLHLQQWLLMGSGNLDALENGLQSLEKVTGKCSTLKALAEMIDDAECLSNTLQACSTMFLALKENKIRILCLRIRLNLLKCDIPSRAGEVDTIHVHLAQCYVRSGQLSTAKTFLNHIITDAISWDLKFDLLLTLVELYLATSSLDEAGKALQQARAHYRTYSFIAGDECKSNQLENDGLIARAANLASRFAFRKGHLSLAFRFARQAAKISISIWAAISKRIPASTSSKSNLTISTLTGDLSQLNIGSTKTIDVTTADGAVSWPYLDMHIHCLRHIAEMMEHAGQYDDAMSFWERLQNLSLSTGQPNHISIHSSMNLFRAKSGKVRDIESLHSKMELEHEQTKDLDSVIEALSRAEVLTSDGHTQLAKEALQQISDQLGMLFANLSSESVETSVSSSTNTAHSSRVGGKAISGTAKRGLKAKRLTTLKPATEMAKMKSIVQFPISFDLISAEDRRRALFLRLAINDSKDDASHTVFERPLTYYTGAQYLFRQNYEKARLLVEQASAELRTDSMTSLLLESVIAVPSKGHVPSRKGRVSFLQGGDHQNRTPKVDASQTDAIKSTSEKLLVARQIIELLIQERQHLCPTDILHSLFKLEARVDLLLATMNRPFTTSSTTLVLKVSQSKDIALERERMVSDAELATKDRSALSEWPEIVTDHTTIPKTIELEQLHNLPESWSIISLMLSEAGDEIVLSKTSSGKSPFLIRLPLHRSNEGEGCEEVSYEDSKRELMDIITQANSSSHDTRGSSGKFARAQWHADREALDKRLQLLLEKIEDTWFGGFRGVMSSQSSGPEQVERFRVILDECLDAHLPSRQKITSIPTSRLRIHDHVLEIFLGISNGDENTLDNDIIDLLYFVVDILLLNGERNAYDEIDWDAMLVKVLDGLRTVHQEKPQDNLDQIHTILILDKELEAFPWEALPCLLNHPVSRMPSLSAVFDRLALIRAQSPSASAFTIPRIDSNSNNRARGTYILNPSLDLQSTQSLLEPVLASNLPSFRAVINHTPDETDFIDYLTLNDILLYFGHGSGAQYIRGRTIRALDKCAVTWLMGCSSAKMTTCGKGESFGMPRWYMLANSMAMVGCLWDVTDREIDRVSLSSMSEWGLIDGSDLRVQEALKKKTGKTRKKVAVKGPDDAEYEREGTSIAGLKRQKTLVEAVQKGREASVLRYLCGAAVVVYGVPVVLEQ